MTSPRETSKSTASSEGADDDDLPRDLSHITPAYRRVLWLVVLLNVGYGLIEIVRSARDRLEPRLASALRSHPRIGMTIYRVFALNEPQAEIMGAFGAIALVVNVAAALLLLPHRGGDANARGLYSRDDAIGNAAVVIAAGLVAWTGTRWPDLAVSAIIAGLFLQSSWLIIRHARTDLRDASLPN